MQKSHKIAYSFLAFMLMASLAMAQVQSGKSRLDIGKNADPSTISTKPVSSFIIKGKVPSEISVNSNSAINDFYRDLLLKNANKVVTPKLVTVPEADAKDKLFVDDEISVSNIYPNPAHEFASLDYTLRNSRKEARVSFYNILGGTVGDYQLDSFGNNLRIRTGEWDNGIYFYQLMVDGKKVATKKLLVRHN